MAIQASNSNPVQWWLPECETFNEQEVSGINRKCWCQPWNCADEIRNQFSGDDGLNLTIVALNPLNEIIFEENVPEIESGVYQFSFVPEDEDICNETIKLYLLSGGSELIQDPTFDTGTGWSNGSGGVGWTVTSGRAQAIGMNHDVNNASSASDEFITTFSDTENTLLSFSGQYRYLSGPLSTRRALLNIDLYKDGVFLRRIQEMYENDGSPSSTIISTSYLIPESIDQVRFRVVTDPDAPRTTAWEWDFWMTDFSVIQYDTTDGLKSDCLHIKTNYDGTTLFEYSNNRNFDGIVYEDISPPLSFFIRVPSVFFHNRFPQEDKAIERTGSTVITSSKFKKQKLLQVEHAPDYFHEKMIKVLSHHNVESLGKQWKKEEAYDKEDGDPKYPLKTATCYLTDKNSLRRNVL